MTMIIFTDDIEYAQEIISAQPKQWSSPEFIDTKDIKHLVKNSYNRHIYYKSSIELPLLWKYMFIVKSASYSQYDMLVNLCRDNIRLPHGVICVAGDGKNFHGFKNRPWVAPAGNIYLSAFFAPCQPVENFGIGFTILAAVSVLDAVDNIQGLQGRAGIKWVNDILIDNSKICGVLAHSQAEGNEITGAIIGIGLNVETTPQLEPTPFVPEAASLQDFVSDAADCRKEIVLEKLIQAIDRNYRLLVNGGYKTLLNWYRQRSLVTGREVDICSDTAGSDIKVIASGRVAGIGDNLELFLEGEDRPVSKGRLIIKN